MTCKKLTFSLTASDTVLDSMRHETVQARMWNNVYMTRVLDDDLTGGQKEQHREHGAGPQQQHIWQKEKQTSQGLGLIKIAQSIWIFL